MNSQGFNGVFRDLRRTIQLSEIWAYLALDDVVARYKRTVLGPLWNAAYTLATATAIGVVFGGIFGQPLSKILPYIVGGFVAWAIGPGFVIESANLLAAAAGSIKSSSLPYFFYVMRSVARNVFMSAHSVAVFILVLVVLRLPIWINWLFLPGLIVVLFAIIPFSMLMALLCARFRDIQMFVGSFSQVIYFFTPIMWFPDNLPKDKLAIVTFNPLYYFVDLIRGPMLNRYPLPASWVVVLVASLIGWSLCIATMSVTRRRVAFWV